MSLNPLTKSEDDAKSSLVAFKFFAIAYSKIDAGKLIEFSVDADGKITSANIDFIYNTPLLIRILPAAK